MEYRSAGLFPQDRLQIPKKKGLPEICITISTVMSVFACVHESISIFKKPWIMKSHNDIIMFVQLALICPEIRLEVVPIVCHENTVSED